MLRNFSKLSPWVLTTLLAGCAAGTLGRLNNSGELPPDMAKDLRDRFEVVEHKPEPKPSATPAPAPTPTPTPTPVAGDTSAKAKGKKSKGKKPVELPQSALVSPIAAASPSPSVVTASDEATGANGIKYPKRRPAVDPIWMDEKLVYDLTYFGVSAGNFTLRVKPFKMIDARRVYHIQGNALSSAMFNMIYRVNDMVETYLDYEGLFSHRFHIVLDETKQSRDSLEIYDSKKRQTFYWNRWNHKVRGYSEVKEFQSIPQFPQDSLSALYFLRTQPLPEGGVINIPIVTEGKNWVGVVKVVRREPCSTPFGKKTCVVLNPEAQYKGILKKEGDSFLWLTDDERRIPVRLEAKVKIGTVVAKLTEFEPGKPPSEVALNRATPLDE